jgi:hypothetical protein
LCRASISVRDAVTNARLSSRINVIGTWSRSPDNSPSDRWPRQGAGRTNSAGTATLSAVESLSRRTAMQCVFTVTGVQVAGTTSAAYTTVNWARSTSVARACWNAAGQLQRNCMDRG